MAVNIHITIIELNALHTKRQNLFQELDAVIHLLMEAKHWGLRKSRNATSLNSRFKSLDTLKVKIISVTRSEERFSRNAETDLVCRLLLEKKKKTGHRVHVLFIKNNRPADGVDHASSTFELLGDRMKHAKA